MHPTLRIRGDATNVMPAERECERCVGAPITTVLTPNIERVLGDRRGVLYTLLLSVVAPLRLDAPSSFVPNP